MRVTCRIALTGAAFLLSACGITGGTQHTRFGGGAGAALSDIGVRDETGAYGSFRGEVATTLSATNDHVEVGLRGLIGGRGYDFGNVAGAETTANALDLGLESVIRLYANNSDSTIRPFVEGFVGIGLQRFELEASQFGVTESVDDAAFGPTFGGALGLEIALDDGWDLSFGAESRYSTYEYDNFGGLGIGTLEVDSLDVGGFIMVGTRL